MAMLLAGMVFVLVPREVTIGEIRIFSDQMSWNSTKGASKTLFKSAQNLSSADVPCFEERP